MIEQALYFAIGFLAATLAAIAGAPVVSRRAMRLAVTRARLRAPLSEKQAIADADALRAAHAVERVRIERKLSLAEEAANSLKVALGRQSAELIRLKCDLADLEDALDERQGDNARLAERILDLDASVSAAQVALHDAFDQRDRASASRDAAESRAAELEAEAGLDRARAAVVAARAEYLEGRVEELKDAAKTARGKIATAAAALEAERGRTAALEKRLDEALGSSRNLTDEAAKSAVERRDLTARMAELEERLRLSERAREETLVEHGRRLSALADRERTLAAASAKIVALEARLAALAAEAHARENALSLRAETLAAAQAAAEGSLRTARAEREGLQRENEALRSRLAAANDASRSADVELRESIRRIGRDVVELFSASRGPVGDDPLIDQGRAEESETSTIG